MSTQWKDVVRACLEQHPNSALKTSNLLGHVWVRLLGRDNMRNQSAMWLLQKVMGDELPSMAKVEALSAELQAKYPHLAKKEVANEQ